MAPVRSFSQIDHDVVGTAGKDRLGRLVVGIALDVVQMGRHEDEVAWTRLHVLLEVLTEVDSDVALQHVGCGLGLAMVIRRTHCIRNTSYLTQPDLACARRITATQTKGVERRPGIDDPKGCKGGTSGCLFKGGL